MTFTILTIAMTMSFLSGIYNFSFWNLEHGKFFIWVQLG